MNYVSVTSNAFLYPNARPQCDETIYSYKYTYNVCVKTQTLRLQKKESQRIMKVGVLL